MKRNSLSLIFWVLAVACLPLIIASENEGDEDPFDGLEHEAEQVKEEKANDDGAVFDQLNNLGIDEQDEELVVPESVLKHQQLLDKWQSRVIELDATNYGYFAVAEPRLYDLYVLVTSEDCEDCRNIEQEFRYAANSYWDHLIARRGVRDSKVVLVQVESRNMETVETPVVPRIMFIPRTEVEELDRAYGSEIEPPTEYTDVKTMYSSMLSGMIRKHSRVQIPNAVSSDDNESSNLTFYIFIFAILQAIAMNWEYITGGVDFWIRACVCVYVVAISGFFFCLIRGAMPFYLDGSGRFMLVHPQRNQQFILEGIVAAGLNVGAAACLYAIVVYLPQTKRGDELQSTIKVAMVVFVLLYVNIVTLFRYKAPWYLRMG